MAGLWGSVDACLARVVLCGVVFCCDVGGCGVLFFVGGFVLCGVVLKQVSHGWCGVVWCCVVLWGGVGCCFLLVVLFCVG